ncbi:MAG: carbonic anhydrase, partial [Rivihabitans pingtungensis]
YAVISLQVERIIVLGHASCGGIRALMEGITDHQEDGGFLAKWLSIADPAREFVLAHHANDNVATQLAVAERVSILVSLDNLMSFPWVRNRVETGKLQLLGWYFDIQEGALYGFDAHSKRFTPLVCPLGAV